MNSASVIFEPDEIRRIRRIIYPRWMNGAISVAEWDAMSYADQCDVMEIKRAIDENTAYDYAVRR